MTTAIIDLSAIFRRYWHASEGENVSSAKRKTLEFVRSLYGDHDDIVVALDSPPYKRSEVYPEYKANREPMPESIKSELKATVEEIACDGWKVAKCQGYEADDVIATLTQEQPESEVYGSDKDLLQCCDLIDPMTKKISSAMSRLKVDRESVVDYLALIGDSSDNIKGVNKVGPVTAVKMLDKYGSIKGIYDALNDDPGAFTQATTENLREAMAWIDTTRQIIQLDDDLELDIEQREVDRTIDSEQAVDGEADIEECEETAIEPAKQTAIAKPVVSKSYETITYKDSLEPVGLEELIKMSNWLFNSGLYGGFINAQATMAAIMHGREIGLGAVTALSSIYVVNGRPTISAEALVALCKSSPVCEYLQCTERTAERATWKTKRRGNPEPTIHTVTFEEAKAISPDRQLRQLKAQPATMIMWKAAAAICRMEYPDVTRGMMAREEMSD